LASETVLMKIPRLLLFITAILSLGLLSGCVSIIEEIDILEDGSGTLRFALGVETENYQAFQEAVPEGYALENLLVTLAGDENVSSVQYDQYTADDRTWDSVELDVEDFTALFEETRRIGPVEINFDEQAGEFTFNQSIDLANSTLTIPGVNLMDLSTVSLTVNLSTPQIIETNGIQSAAGVSTWSSPLDEVLQGGSTVFLSADYVLEPYQGYFIPWEVFFPYVVIGFLALGGISILVVILVNTIGGREKKSTLKFK